MHASATRSNKKQGKSANNRATRQRRKRHANGEGYEMPQRGITATSGSKGARRRKNGK